MKLSMIQVENFRLLKKLRLDMQDDLSLVIGKNNCGKTSLLAILDRFIGTRASNNMFLWDDFSLSFQKHLFMLINEKDLSKEQILSFPIGIRLNLYISYNEKDDLSNISSIMMDLNPEIECIQNIKSFVIFSKTSINTFLLTNTRIPVPMS